LQLYSVDNCYSNERWNLIYQSSNGFYCFQSVKFGQYLSDDTDSNPNVNGVGHGTPVYRDACQNSEYLRITTTASGGFSISANTGNWQLYYESDLSTPQFNTR
jgi:hypothetical protein